MTSRNKSAGDPAANSEVKQAIDEQAKIGLPLDAAKTVSPQVIAAAIAAAKQRVSEIASISPEAAKLMQDDAAFWNLVGNQPTIKGKFVKFGTDRMIPVGGESIEHLRVALASLPIFVSEAREKVRAAIEEWNAEQMAKVDEMFAAANAALERVREERRIKVAEMGYDFDALFEGGASTLVEKRAPATAVATHQPARGRKSAGKMSERWLNVAYPHPSLARPVINGWELVVERVSGEWVLTAVNTHTLEVMTFKGNTVNAAQAAFLEATSPPGASTQRSAVATFKMHESDELYSEE